MSEDTIKRTYELGYILVPTTPEVEVSAEVEKIKDAIGAVQGTIVFEGAPEFIDLAYTMEKNIASKKMKWSQGYFGWMKFESTPESMEALKKSLDANTTVIRYLLVKTTIENTVTFKKPKLEPKRGEGTHDDEFKSLEDAVEEIPENAADDTSEEIKEHHELLPDVVGDIVDAPLPEAIEGEEKEEVA